MAADPPAASPGRDQRPKAAGLGDAGYGDGHDGDRIGGRPGWTGNPLGLVIPEGDLLGAPVAVPRPGTLPPAPSPANLTAAMTRTTLNPARWLARRVLADLAKRGLKPLNRPTKSARFLSLSTKHAAVPQCHHTNGPRF
jgi:hypothetical protein